MGEVGQDTSATLAQIVWSPTALRNLFQIANYIAQDNPAAARIAQQLTQVANSLAAFPLRGASNGRPSQARARALRNFL